MATRTESSVTREEIAQSLLGKSGKFAAWFRLYDDLLSRRRFQTHPPTSSKTITNSEIVAIAKLLRHNVRWTRDQLTTHLLNETGNDYGIVDLEIALEIAVQVMFLVDCDATTWHAAEYRLGGIRPTCWASSESFCAFMQRAFPRSTNVKNTASVLQDQHALKGWKLEKRLGLTVKGTIDLSNHLLYDPRHNVVYVFHHVAFLQAHLNGFAKDIPFDSTLEDCLLKGALPPRLICETLHSLQSILFPSIDQKAHKMMQRLIKEGGFDPECEQYSGYRHKDLHVGRHELQYEYWGERLAILHRLFIHKPPRNGIERWVRWRSSEANALALAMLALFISIVVGLVSIGLSAVQIWIAWMAWKHPMEV
ncbi:hypothetical protein BKA66DRAFT_504406 [Pyrenochaeta sp. MPI-SDFR-AT-0127]|nr:hypothetical protein BKA66DRAFT_504406 [Pyrenochaeta sp. MPI-SDFR-AT-0127]